MTNLWHSRFLDMAALVSSWSKDPSTKVGAVIVDDSNRVVSLGYNGFPRGVLDTPERLLDRETKYAMTLHAEENALLLSPRSVAGCTVYATHCPCASCAAKIIQAGVRRVISPVPSEEFLSRWSGSVKLSEEMFFEAGVETLQLPLSD